MSERETHTHDLVVVFVIEQICLLKIDEFHQDVERHSLCSQ